MTRVILDFPAAGTRDAASRLVFRQPRQVLATASPAGVRQLLRDVQAAAAGRWAVGFVAYEAAPSFDSALATQPPGGVLPLVWFAIFDTPESMPPPDVLLGTEPPPRLEWRTDTQRTRYDDAVARIRDAIAAGDVYQVNHTLRFRARCSIAPAQLYDRLVSSRHGLYHALIETDEWAIVSASPELFLDVAAGTVTTRPMKGTIRRGRWLEEDDAAAAALARSPKDRAENVMIVDLLRNDLGRIAEPGSVVVPARFAIETYPTVHQMTSTVTARVREDVSLDELFAATFPCGSVTGAPKVTAMQTIARLESDARGVYCGAVGCLRPDGSMTFNVAIRTVTIDRSAGHAEYGSGGGITWDSRADAEYAEVTAKAALLTETIPPFLLVETMRMDDGVIARLPLHLQRLAASAAYWDFADDVAARAAAELDRLSTALPRGRWRVRLTAARSGAIEITRSTLAAAPGDRADEITPLRVELAAPAVSRHDRLLFHKTTARDAYNCRLREHPGAFDVLLFNEDGEATEFSIGNLVVEYDGALLTPARSSGLLAGCMRAELLRDGTIEERVVTLESVRRAPRLWLINSVRGWVRVALMPTAGAMPD